MVALPNEMWLRIFGLVDDSKSLGCVVLVCRKFHTLGTEALFWEANPSKAHLVRSLSFTLKPREVDANVDWEYLQIFGCIQSFTKLRELKLSFGTIPDILYRTLQYLPNLTHITVEGCAVSPPPPFFPFSFPSTSPPAPISATTLTVSKLRPSHMGFLLDAVTVPLAYHLPNLHTFVTDAIGIQIPSEVSARLTSLTLNLRGVLGDIQPRLDVLLQRMPALTELTVTITQHGHHAPHGAASTVSPGPAAPLPLLRTLAAPWPAAGHVISGAPALAHLRVTSTIAKPGDAVWLLERLRGATLRSAALRVHAWDDEVLLAAARCLPACEALEVAYQEGAPSDVRFRSIPVVFLALTPPRVQSFLFNLGIHHLPLLRALHTLRLYTLPPVVDTAPLRFVWDPAPGPVLESTVPAGQEASYEEESDEGEDEDVEGEGAEAREKEAAAALKEYVHAWARYNPALARVQLGTEVGRAWVRAPGGAGWSVDGDDDARAEEWALMCVAG
ncbi:hypothetical protein DFH07DRAFT_970159 [Mycena maculata]|uniref:F-box domain-containing protein n=1 Tax=Mycena maculata TaxID=230809 RepID=A0AAD7HU24_9AGAR|nr:hypothetical protein DFH07DRAFT_970159 [Mycena maculata]